MKNHGWLSFGGAALAALLALGSAGIASAQPIYPNAPYSATPRIDQREARQERRIDRGIRSGEITRREARRLDAQQRRIRHMQRRARADGVVTRAERRQIAAEQQRASRMIQRTRNNDRRY